MDPTQGNKQGNQAQEKQSGPGIIDRIKSLQRAKKLLPIGKTGLRVAVQAGRSFFTFLAANPGVWIPILVIGFLFVSTLVIVLGFAGAPPLEASPQESNLFPTAPPPTIAPTETKTPTPSPAAL